MARFGLKQRRGKRGDDLQTNEDKSYNDSKCNDYRKYSKVDKKSERLIEENNFDIYCDHSKFSLRKALL